MFLHTKKSNQFDLSHIKYEVDHASIDFIRL